MHLGPLMKEQFSENRSDKAFVVGVFGSFSAYSKFVVFGGVLVRLGRWPYETE